MAKRSNSKDLELARSHLGNRTVVLVGMMGAGKTSVGRRLAEKLGFAFVDADHEIEAAAGKSVPDIFADHGEAYFREGEKRVIARLLENPSQVLATGGGAFINPETRARIKDQAVSVWLKADLALLMKRISRRDNRPLLQVDDPEAVLRNLIAARYPVYAEADFTVESRDVQHSQMVNDVIRTIAEAADGAKIQPQLQGHHVEQV
jgi:shikimate kinase